MPLPTRAARLACLCVIAFGLATAPALSQDKPGAAVPAATMDSPATAPTAESQATVPEAGEWQTSSSLIGPSKYPADFQHYDYVNPDAPKGGTLNSVAIGSFDSLNPFVVRGTPAAGLAVFGGGILYDTLMGKSVV